MKNKLKLFGVIAVVAIIGYSLVGCGIDTGDDKAGALVQYLPVKLPVIFQYGKLAEDCGVTPTANTTFTLVGISLVADPATSTNAGILEVEIDAAKLGIKDYSKIVITCDEALNWAGGQVVTGTGATEIQYHQYNPAWASGGVKIITIDLDSEDFHDGNDGENDPVKPAKDKITLLKVQVQGVPGKATITKIEMKK